MVNLNNKFYCVIEVDIILVILKSIFNNYCYFVYYDVLFFVELFGDEGVVNYNCLGGEYDCLVI